MRSLGEGGGLVAVPPLLGSVVKVATEKEGENMYNGYANQDEFHKALEEGNKKYAEAYEKAMKENPQGWTHANCDHAYGYCAG